MTRFFTAAAMVIVAAGSAAADDKYTLTGDNTTITFVGTKKDGKHEGGFKKVTGSMTNTTAGMKLEIEIDCDSMHTDNDNLTKHLKGGDFFNVKENPTAKFESTKIEKGDKGYTITGKLTMCGKSKEISFPAEITAGDTLTLTSEFKIDRTDYGISFKPDAIDKEVALKVKVEAKK